MKRMLISFSAVIMLAVTARAGVPDDGTSGWRPAVKPAVAAARRLPWQEVQPFYWDRATPLHLPAIEQPHNKPLRRTRYLPLELTPGSPMQKF